MPVCECVCVCACVGFFVCFVCFFCVVVTLLKEVDARRFRPRPKWSEQHRCLRMDMIKATENRMLSASVSGFVFFILSVE